MDTQLGVQQDRVGPAPTVFRPLTNMLVPQAQKPVASFMKRLRDPKMSITTFEIKFINYFPWQHYSVDYHLPRLDYATKIFTLTHDCGCPTALIAIFF